MYPLYSTKESWLMAVVIIIIATGQAYGIGDSQLKALLMPLTMVVGIANYIIGLLSCKSTRCNSTWRCLHKSGMVKLDTTAALIYILLSVGILVLVADAGHSLRSLGVCVGIFSIPVLLFSTALLAARHMATD